MPSLIPRIHSPAFYHCEGEKKTKEEWSLETRLAYGLQNPFQLYIHHALTVQCCNSRKGMSVHTWYAALTSIPPAVFMSTFCLRDTYVQKEGRRYGMYCSVYKLHLTLHSLYTPLHSANCNWTSCVVDFLDQSA